jgi:hypothetical protein
VPSQPRQVRQSRVLHGSWSWRIYGWLCSQQCNTDVCCLAAFAHWQGEDYMPFFYWVNCVMHWMYADNERKNCAHLYLLVSPFSRNF